MEKQVDISMKRGWTAEIQIDLRNVLCLQMGLSHRLGGQTPLSDTAKYLIAEHYNIL